MPTEVYVETHAMFPGFKHTYHIVPVEPCADDSTNNTFEVLTVRIPKKGNGELDVSCVYFSTFLYIAAYIQ